MSTLAGGAALVWLAACGHDAWLGRLCPEHDKLCEDAGGQSVVTDAGRELTPTDTAEVLPDAQVADPTPASGCRKLAMSYFACASPQEMAGVPQLRAGQAYTLRVRGPYSVNTSFQVQGATSTCTAVMFGTLTLAAGAPAVEHCLTPPQDLALLFTVVSGDVQVWSPQGLTAEVCEGCQ